MALSTKQKWGIGVAVSGGLMVVVGSLAGFAVEMPPLLDTLLNLIGVVAVALGFQVSKPPAPPVE